MHQALLTLPMLYGVSIYFFIIISTVYLFNKVYTMHNLH
jgi:hypothetical protein